MLGPAAAFFCARLPVHATMVQMNQWPLDRLGMTQGALHYARDDKRHAWDKEF